MVEANHNLQQAQLRATMNIAVRVLAQQQAIKAVKHQLRARGLKVHSFAHRDIVAMARDYIAQHPELLAEAKETVLRWQAEGFFGKRTARALERNSQVTCNAEFRD